MANPKFTDMDGNFGYIWQELPVISSDRPDIATFLNNDRAFVEYKYSSIMRSLKYLTQRAEFSFKWLSITQAMTQAFLTFFGQAYFRFYPDADNGTYTEIYISNQFAPKWRPGGLYDLTLELREYSPFAF